MKTRNWLETADWLAKCCCISTLFVIINQVLILNLLLLYICYIVFSATPNNGTRSQNVSPTPSEMSMMSMVDFETSFLDESIRRVSLQTRFHLIFKHLYTLYDLINADWPVSI